MLDNNEKTEIITNKKAKSKKTKVDKELIWYGFLYKK
jgi:hypothetical protein